MKFDELAFCRATSLLLAAAVVLLVFPWGRQSNSVSVSKKSGDSIFVGNAGCLIKKDGKILMVKQRNGKLGTPGGTAEDGETAIDTAVREVMEETGVQVKVVRLNRYFAKSGFYLFECDIAEEPVNYGPGDDFKDEIKGAVFVDANTLTKDDLRFPYQLDWYREYQGK